MNPIALTDRPARQPRVLKQEAGGTVVLLGLDEGRYYSLDEIGGRIWDLCDGARTVAQIAALLAAEYEAPPETITQDLVELLDDLANEKLVQRQP